MTLTEKIAGLTSRRVRDVADPDAPSVFQTTGGWAPADAASGARLDPAESETSARRSGMLALAELESNRRPEASPDAGRQRIRGQVI